ncbi:uncharacterized protein [Cicer arietinum]|uniref:uncharacterized protein n=1 Tax=Cicer arietinum TaxID=3827 RepID=UPI003CC6C041
MENKRWLNIVVDGNKALEKYWIDIVSNYLEKIVRCFVGENQEQMYPKPSDTMTEREYYNSERHCILVVPGDPVPKRMAVCVPMIQKAQVIGQRLQACQADFLEVAQKCVPLAVSLSVITPNPVPIFGAIFNLGNNVLTLSNAPISSYSTGQLTILLSKNFKEAHNALKEKRIMEIPKTTSVESINAPPDFKMLSRNLQEEQLSSIPSEVTIGEKINIASNVATHETVNTSQPLESQSLILPKFTNEENVASTSTPFQINLYDEIIAELRDDRDLFTSNKRSKTFTSLEEDDDLTNLFELDQNSFEGINPSFGQDREEKQISKEDLQEVEIEFEEAWNCASNNNSNNQTSNDELTPSLPKDVQASTSNLVEGSSTRLIHDLTMNKSVLNPILKENTSQSTSLAPQQQTWYNLRDTKNTSIWDSPEFSTRVSNENFTFLNAMGNSSMQLQQNSSISQYPMFSAQFVRGSMENFSRQPMGQNFQGYQYFRNNMAPFDCSAYGASAWIRPTTNLTPTYPRPNLYAPTFNDFQDYVHSWEGSIVGKFSSSRLTIIKAKAFRKATTPITLTFRWTSRLEISHFVPQKAVNHTKKFSQPIDYVLFNVIKYSNVDLYNHLKNKNLCAKIDLNYQSIILSPSERELFFVGAVFPGDTLFIEPA